MASEDTSRSPAVSSRRMWFSLLGAAGAWVILGFADMIITWQACLHHEEFGGASAHTGLLILNMVVFFLLLAISVWAGILAYRTWRHRSAERNLLFAEAQETHEYMAVASVLIAVTMGVGIIWLGIPLWMISLCLRTR